MDLGIDHYFYAPVANTYIGSIYPCLLFNQIVEGAYAPVICTSQYPLTCIPCSLKTHELHSLALPVAAAYYSTRLPFTPQQSTECGVSPARHLIESCFYIRQIQTENLEPNVCLSYSLPSSNITQI